MDAQLSVRIPRHLREALDRASRKSGLRNSDIVRLALQKHLSLPDVRAMHLAQRVRVLLGSLDSSIADLAENQRTYIIESLTGGE
jgi:predicted DNA-binding protein